MSSHPTDKKLFVDEDWKSRVEREKMTAEAQGGEPQISPPHPSSPSDLPPASLLTLIQMLNLQAAHALGLLENKGETGRSEVRPEEARHFIDLLHVLEQKTRGNRNEAESQALEISLHQLRMAFVQVVGP